MSTGHQIVTVTAMNLRCLPDRLGGSLVIVMGMAAVVGVAVSLLAMSGGLLQIIAGTGRPDRAIVVGSGTSGMGGGNITRANVLTLIDGPGIRRGADGNPIVSMDVTMPVITPRKDGTGDTILPLWGLQPGALDLRSEVRLVEGRMFTPALHEVIVGRKAQAVAADLEIGGHIDLPQGQWAVVGVFDAGGGILDSSILADAESVMAVFQRNSFSSVTLQLLNEGTLDEFRDWVQGNPGLEALEVKREDRHYYDQFKEPYDAIRLIAVGLGAIMAIGATFGALNTMYSAVSARQVETATLRALGFGGAPIVISVLAEALLLAFAGALLGVAAAWLAFAGHKLNVGPLALTLTILPAHLVIALGFGLAVGLFGGLLPAWRAARVPVVTALRAA